MDVLFYVILFFEIFNSKGKRMLPKSFTWFDWMIDGDDGICQRC
jgi:hypothetical protein